jgi:predicted secreted protein
MRVTAIVLAMMVMVPAAPVQAEEKAKKDSERIICKSERFVGSHMSTRICKTKAEWTDGKRKAIEALDHERDKNQIKHDDGAG